MFFLGLASSAYGASENFLVYPIRQEVIINPGENKDVFFTIANNLATDSSFLIGLENLSQVKSRGGKDSSALNSVVQFTTFDSGPVRIGKGQKIKIPIRISIPAGVTPGGYYGVVTVTNQSDSLGQTKISSAVGSALFVRVSGKVTEKGEIVNFGLSGKNFIFGNPPLNFQTTFSNTGNIYLNPYGLLEIKNILGQRVKILEYKPWSVLPGASVMKVVSLPNHSLWGYYQAHLYLNLGYENKVWQRTVSFFVVPWWLLALVLVVLVGLIIFFKLKLKK